MATTYKTALVTGGAGFIGSHVADALVRRRIKTYIVDDLSTGRREWVNPNAQFAKLSITSPAFLKYLRAVKPDVVFHHAAQIDLRAAVEDPPMDAAVNIMGTLHLAHAAARLGVKKFVFASTGGAMYPDRLRPPYTEETPDDPVSPYGISKRAAEMYLEFEHVRHGMPYVILRYANVYGPRQRVDGEAGVVAIFGGRMLSGKPTIINGDGRQTRDFVHVSDVVRANLAALARPANGRFNIGTGRQTSILQLFKLMNRMTGAGTEERHGPAMNGEVLRTALSYKKAKTYLGWEPKVKLEDGLRETIEWMRARLK